MIDNFIPVILLFMLPLVWFHIKKGKATPYRKQLNFPYHTKYILTNSEYKFYLAFKPLMDRRAYIICPKVGLKDLFEVNSGIKDRMKYFRQISQKHVDFLICNADLRPLFAIELDDKSHNRAEVKERDQFKDNLFKSAGFPLYRIPTSAAYSEEYIKSHIPLFGWQEENSNTRTKTT